MDYCGYNTYGITIFGNNSWEWTVYDEDCDDEIWIARDDVSREDYIYIHKGCECIAVSDFKCDEKDCNHEISGKAPRMVLENCTNWNKLPFLLINEPFVGIENFKNCKWGNCSLNKCLKDPSYNCYSIHETSYYTSLRCDTCRTRFEWTKNGYKKWKY